MLRDGAIRYAHQMPLLTEDGVAMTPQAVQWRLQLVEGCPVPVMESNLEFNVAHAIEIEREGGSICASFFGLAIEVNNTSRLWLRLSLIAEKCSGGGCFEDVIAHWQRVEQFLPSTETQDSLAISGEIILLSIDSRCAWLVLTLQFKLFVVFWPKRVQSGHKCSWL